nr:hypothetical protein GCM10020185_01580 [Pseudomonas brassicacearum subsp. brassicacearum]
MWSKWPISTAERRRVPPLGGLGIGVGEVAEAFGIFGRFAIDGQGMLRCCIDADGACQQDHGSQ